MAVTYEYKSRDILELSSIEKASENCKRVVNNFSAVKDGSINFEMSPTLLPVFDLSSYGELVGPDITGILNRKDKPYSAFKEVLLAAQNKRFGDYAKVRVTIEYEALGCKQSKRDYNSLGVWYENDRLMFSYYDRTVYKVKEEGYHRKVFERVIAAGDLPLEIEDVGEYFALGHRDGGILSFGQALLGPTGDKVNPDGMRCELMNESIDSVLNRLETVLSKVSSGKIFSYEWCVWYMYHENGPATSAEGLGNELYNLVVEQDFPAERYYISGFLKHASMEGVDFIQQICGPKDEALVPIFACQHPHEPDGYLNAGIYIKSAGFELMIESSDYIEASELSQMLGIEMVEAD